MTLTIGRRFALTTGSLMLAMAIAGGAAIYNLADQNRLMQLIVSDPLMGTIAITGARSSVLGMEGDVWQHIASADPALKAELDRQIEAHRVKADQELVDYEKTITQEDDRAIFRRVMAEWPRYTSALPAAMTLSRAGKGTEAAALYNRDIAPVFAALEKALDEDTDWNAKRGDQLAAQSASSYARARLMLLLALLASMAGGGMLAYLIGRSTNRLLRHVAAELLSGADQV
jgi:methyl-accepting chemotaxis protein